MLEKILNSQ